MGPSCSGKSTTAIQVKDLIGAEIFTGRDYLRMAKNQNEAWRVFYEKLSNAAFNQESASENIIYLITEKAQLDKIASIKGSCKVKFTASLETIKSRFSQRMHGKLPPPVEKMLVNQYEEWKNIKGDINVDTTDDNAIAKIVGFITRP